VLVLLLSTCSGEHPQSSIDPKTDFAESIHSLYVMIFWVAITAIWFRWTREEYQEWRREAREFAARP